VIYYAPTFSYKGSLWNKSASAFSEVFVAGFDCKNVQAFKLLKRKVKYEGIKRQGKAIMEERKVAM